jgi:hypothetical protein
MALYPVGQGGNSGKPCVWLVRYRAAYNFKDRRISTNVPQTYEAKNYNKIIP